MFEAPISPVNARWACFDGTELQEDISQSIHNGELRHNNEIFLCSLQGNVGIIKIQAMQPPKTFPPFIMIMTEKQTRSRC